MDKAAFRINFPEFANTATYPDGQLDLWATVAESLLPQDMWQDNYTLATNLYVAHELVIAQQNLRLASNGGPPGTFGGVAQSKAVGAVNVTYDSVGTSNKDASFWNLTVYGKQLYRLMLLFGAGSVQL